MRSAHGITGVRILNVTYLVSVRECKGDLNEDLACQSLPVKSSLTSLTASDGIVDSAESGQRDPMLLQTGCRCQRRDRTQPRHPHRPDRTRIAGHER